MTKGFLRFVRGNTIALLALFIALGGTTYAATALPANSVGTKQLKKNAVTAIKLKSSAVTNGKLGANAVTGAKVKDDSLTGADVLESSLGKVPSASTADTAAAATNATNATNAANFAGKPASAYKPVLDFEEDGPGALDPDANPVVCQSVDYTSTGNEVASVQGVASLLAGAGTMTTGTHIVVSIDGGASWSAVNGWFTRSTAGASAWETSTSFANEALTAGTTYEFGVQVTRIVPGTIDATDSRCNLTMAVYDQ